MKLPVWMTTEADKDGWQSVVRIKDWPGRPPAPHVEGRIRRPVQHQLKLVEDFPDDAAIWFYIGTASETDKGHMSLGMLRAWARVE